MAKKKPTSACYVSPTFKKRNKEWYETQVSDAQRLIDDVVRKIYNDDFPTDKKCSKRIPLFNGCTPIHLPDNGKEAHLEEIRNVLEDIFMVGRMFGLAEARCAGELAGSA